LERKTKIEHLDDYTEFMKVRAIPDYEKTSGFIKLTFMRRADDTMLDKFWLLLLNEN